MCLLKLTFKEFIKFKQKKQCRVLITSISTYYSFLPEFTGSVNIRFFCACLVHWTSLYNSSKRFICKSLVELYLNVMYKLFPKEQRSGGGLSSPQNVPMSWLEHLGPSLISMYDPKHDGNSNNPSASCTLFPSCAKITQVHCLPEPQTAGLFELLMNPDVSLA